MARVHHNGVAPGFFEDERAVEAGFGDGTGLKAELGERCVTSVDVVNHEIKWRLKIVRGVAFRQDEVRSTS